MGLLRHSGASTTDGPEGGVAASAAPGLRLQQGVDHVPIVIVTPTRAVGADLESLAGSEDELCSATFSELLQDDELRLLNRDCIFFLEDFKLFSMLPLPAPR